MRSPHARSKSTVTHSWSWLLAAAVTLPLCLAPGTAHANPETPVLPAVADSDGDGTLDTYGLEAAALAASEAGLVVEDLSRRTERTRVLVNPDWSVDQESYAAPAWVKNAEGRWVDVNYDLVSRPGGGFVPAASPAAVVVDGGGAREFARLDLPGGGSTIWSWPEPLPSPTVVGPAATYAVGDGVDLVVTATATGVSTRIRINTPDAVAPEFTVQVRTEGVNLRQTDAGQLLFADDGKTTAHTPTLTAWDGRLDRFGDPVEVVPVEAELEQVAEVGERTDVDVTLTTPGELVSDPDVEYPIVIDPDVNSLAPSQDTWVRRDTTWIENSYRLMTGRLDDSPNDNPTISYIQWPNGSIQGRQITKATLHLFQYAAGTCSSRRMNIHPLSQAWSDATALYSNKPPAATTTGASSYLTKNVGGDGCSTPNGWVTADVQKLVLAWAQGPSDGGFANHGMQLNAPSESAGDVTFERRFCSMNPDPTHTTCTSSARAPYLSFSYQLPPKPVLPTAFQLANAVSTTPQLVTNRAVNDISVKVSLPSGATCGQPSACLTARFSITNSVGQLVAEVDSADRVPSGGRVRVPTPSLADGTYTVTVRARNLNRAGLEHEFSDPATFGFLVDLQPPVPTWSWVVPGQPTVPAQLPPSQALQVSVTPVMGASLQYCLKLQVNGATPTTPLCQSSPVFVVGPFTAGDQVAASVALQDAHSMSEWAADSPATREISSW